MPAAPPDVKDPLASARDCYTFRMSDDRLPRREGPAQPGAYFRCLPCQRLVTATARGVCPRCGWSPPSLVAASPRPARGLAAVSAWYWIAAVAVSVAAGFAAASFALRLW